MTTATTIATTTTSNTIQTQALMCGTPCSGFRLTIEPLATLVV
jgi:hypothetical protein